MKYRKLSRHGVAFCFLKIPYMDPRERAHVKPGMEVDVILKKDQRTGTRTRGFVKRLLTSAPYHTRGIKVMLDDGQVGRVIEIIDSATD